MRTSRLMLGPFTAAVVALLAPASACHADIIYVSNATSGTIEKYDSTTGADLGTFASGLSTPEGLAFDSSGNL